MYIKTEAHFIKLKYIVEEKNNKSDYFILQFI
jgi:hypothetical protein